MSEPNTQERINAAWSYNAALAYLQAITVTTVNGASAEAELGRVDRLAEAFYPRIDLLVAKMQAKGVVVAPTMASDGQKKYIKSLIFGFKDKEAFKLLDEVDKLPSDIASEWIEQLKAGELPFLAEDKSDLQEPAEPRDYEAEEAAE